MFEKPQVIESHHIQDWIQEIALFPARLLKLTENLNDEQLNWKYRPKGWTIQQVIHHCADSHMNSFTRFKLSLTEDLPTIKPFLEDKWAELPDTTETPIFESIKILEGLHSRWIKLLKSLNSNDLEKEFFHPEHGKRFSIAENIGIYAWHSNHHLAHIKLALENKGLTDKYRN